MKRGVVEMPAAVPVTYEAFLELEKRLKYMRFVEMRREEVSMTIHAHGLMFPPQKKIPASEIGFKYTAHGYTVKVWTSCLRKEVERWRNNRSGNEIVSRPTGTDYGWVVIVDPFGKAQYFAKPSMRTLHFVTTFSQRVWITQWKVEHRVLCPECKKFMDICENQHGGNYWGCFQRDFHASKEYVGLSWDYELPPRAKRIAESWRQEYYASRKRTYDERGEYPRHARMIRKTAKETRNPFL